MRSALPVLLTACLLAGAPAAGAAPPPPSAAQSSPPAPARPPVDDGSAVVAELEVIGRPPGPAMWRVRRGGSEVVILGSVSPLPQSLQWDQGRVKRALAGARQLLLTSPEATLGMLDAPGAAIQMLRLRALTPLPKRTPPALYARVVAAARVAKMDPAKLSPWRPAPAGGLLIGGFQHAAGLSMAKPGSTVQRLAKAAHVPVRTVTRVSGMPLLAVVVHMDEAQQQRCLAAAVDEVDWEAGHAVAVAQAWAVGRVERARAERSQALWGSCLESLPTLRALDERGIAGAFTAIQAALAQPGRTVAVVDLRHLDTRNGLLDRLRAAGAQVDLPPE